MYRRYVFNPSSPVTTVPLLEGPQFPDDPLISVYRVKDGLEYIYNRQPNILVSPLMLSPSYAKVLYADRLRSFFWGLGKTGGLNKGVIVIGYSIPQHDNFARQILLHIFSNYQQLYWEEEYAGSIKKPVLHNHNSAQAPPQKYTSPPPFKAHPPTITQQ